MAHLAKGSDAKLTLKRQEAREFHLLYWVCFAVFLVCAAFARLMPWRGSKSNTGLTGVRRSVLAEARASASTLIPFAFMK
jgi:hypothetical protein